ncbi:hypothetical protein GCM10027610_040470 [Dactylosporangium cerinum]
MHTAFDHAQQTLGPRGVALDDQRRHRGEFSDRGVDADLAGRHRPAEVEVGHDADTPAGADERTRQSGRADAFGDVTNPVRGGAPDDRTHEAIQWLHGFVQPDIVDEPRTGGAGVHRGETQPFGPGENGSWIRYPQAQALLVRPDPYLPAEEVHELLHARPTFQFRIRQSSRRMWRSP